MSVQTGWSGLRSANLYDRIITERHNRMVDSAARRLARELNAYGCPAPRSELARRCGVEHWSKTTLDEAAAAAERAGLLRSLPLGWVAPADPLGGTNRRRGMGLHPWPTRLGGRTPR
ncbi:MAG TPA: hypothetical protein VG228_07830 [Solirubrobacteraceae bacterium]|jgi:hypothetical protein|nr:hypothetical protein [Solirubrobacteraceae bacterium]